MLIGPPRGNTLQHTATHCNTLQHTATHCNTMQHTVTHFNAVNRLRYSRYWLTAAHCDTQNGQHTAPHYDTMQHTGTHCDTLRMFITPHVYYPATHFGAFNGGKAFVCATCCFRRQRDCVHCIIVQTLHKLSDDSDCYMMVCGILL